MEHHHAEELRIRLNELMRKQSDVLHSRMWGTASEAELLEYEIRQELIHDLCNVLAHSRRSRGNSSSVRHSVAG